MAYSKINWQDGSGGGTPLSAANLNVMDTGIDDAHTDIANRALIGHNHDGSYAPISHSHSYASIGHTHTSSDAPTRDFKTETTNYTLTIGDAGYLILMNSTGAVNLTVPPNSSVAFPLGTFVDVWQHGAGQVTIVQGSGVTVRTIETLKLTGQYAGATITKIGTNEWLLVGHLADS